MCDESQFPFTSKDGNARLRATVNVLAKAKHYIEKKINVQRCKEKGEHCQPFGTMCTAHNAKLDE